MSSHRIEKLLENYFEGETSLSEERMLREFFRQKEIPAHLVELKEQFELYEEEGQATLPGDFDDALFEEIRKQDRGRKAYRRTTIYYITGVAATILLLISVFVRFDPFIGSSQANDSETEMAFNEASRILYFVSDRFNKGANPLSKVARFDEGIKDLSSMKKFDEGISKTSPISRFSQITKLITNPAP